MTYVCRSARHAIPVSWLRRTEYISTEATRFQPTTMDKVEAKVGFSIKKTFKEDNTYLDHDSQIRAIEKTFEDAKKPIEKHYSKAGVTAVEVLPILPDFNVNYPVKIWRLQILTIFKNYFSSGNIHVLKSSLTQTLLQLADLFLFNWKKCPKLWSGMTLLNCYHLEIS